MINIFDEIRDMKEFAGKSRPKSASKSFWKFMLIAMLSLTIIGALTTLFGLVSLVIGSSTTVSLILTLPALPGVLLFMYLGIWYLKYRVSKTESGKRDRSRGRR